MKKLSCRDVGILDCSWEGSADTEEDLLRQARQHGLDTHNYRVTPEDEKKMRAAIKTV